MNTNIRHLNIEVTKRCNQRCFYCFNDSGVGSRANELSPERWLGILRALQPKGLESIHLTGGEPFAYPHAVDILAGAQEIGLGTSILSNGFRVPELTNTFPDVFRDLRVAQISLDSMDETVHNRRRNYAWAWQDAVSAIRVLRALNVSVEVSCVISESNLIDLESVADFCEGIDAGLIVRPMVSVGRATIHPISQSFACDLELCLQSLKTNRRVNFVEDRFHYVPDEQSHIDFASRKGLFTVLHDGTLRGDHCSITNVFAVAA